MLEGGTAMSDGMGSSNRPIDRRRARRYSLSWVAKVILEDSADEGEQVATLRNLSSTGALACLKTSPRLGQRMLVSFKLPFEIETWMRYSAIVVRVKEATAGADVAVKFDQSRPEFVKPQF